MLCLILAIGVMIGIITQNIAINYVIFNKNYSTCQHQNSLLPPKDREVVDQKMLAPIQQEFDLLVTASKFCTVLEYQSCITNHIF